MIAYLVTNTVNGKQYVGISRDDTVDDRWRRHVRDALVSAHPGMLIGKAIRKYGASSFLIEVIACAKTWKNLCDVEGVLIRQHETRSPAGYNLTAGGDGVVGYKHSFEARQKIGAASFGHQVLPVTRELLSAALKGHQRSPSHVAKLAEAAKASGAAKRGKPGRVISEDAKVKISVTLTGKKHSAERIASIMEGMRNGRQPEHSVDSRAKRSVAISGLMWITNGDESLRVARGQNISIGWRLGRAKMPNRRSPTKKQIIRQPEGQM